MAGISGLGVETPDLGRRQFRGGPGVIGGALAVGGEDGGLGMVELEGIEPSTSSMPLKRSPK